MPDQTIKCPNCGTPIELTEALTGQIEQGNGFAKGRQFILQLKINDLLRLTYGQVRSV